ncbi:hypothetical protein ACCO45_006705 [Purpureocillium lilacinum]|uniref:Uncharacterized protein n=1 Tax=Purpureocillium lilacinum TaxID=33203 RepID=A0ACC4DR04_PURLI
MTFLGYRQAAFAPNSPFEVPALLHSLAQTGSMATMERALEHWKEPGSVTPSGVRAYTYCNNSGYFVGGNILGRPGHST